MKNKNGFISMTLVYTFLILFLFVMLAILKTYSRNNKILTTFSERINSDLKVSNEQKSKLYYRILIDNLNYSDSVDSINVSSSTGINFSLPSSDKNGKGLYYTTSADKSINGKRVYYFRGAVNNNYVIYAGLCFRIIRTAEGNAVKMQYAGVPTNGACPDGTITSPITDVVYNQTTKDNTFIGYKTGVENECESTTTCVITTPTTTYEESTNNKFDSNAKKEIDNWAKDNIYSKGDEITKYLADVTYCSDRKITTASEGYTGTGTQFGYGNNITYYNPYLRYQSNLPTFNCTNDKDKFSQSLASGNGELLYPVGMITMDELMYAGAIAKNGTTTSETHYLANGNQYFTMTPSSHVSNYSNIFMHNADGTLEETNTSQKGKIFPVITLRGDSIIKSGTGLRTSPYIIGD